VAGTPFQADWIERKMESIGWLPTAGDVASAGGATLERREVAALGGATQRR
jgi:hypothetical protein